MKIKIPLLIFSVWVVGCKKPYNPPGIARANSLLVVEGIINLNGITNIKLSRTVNVSNKTSVNPLPGAVVAIENSQNNSYLLVDQGNGRYASDSLNLSTALQYRLRIKTPDNRQYLSDFTVPKVTPPIDSIGFTADMVTNNLHVYANTHDPNNNTHYYLWDYTENWQFHAKYFSNYVSDGVMINKRSPDAYVFYCFQGDTSSDIVLGSSAKLKQDVIYQNTIASIPSTSEKIETRYTIKVNQYALTPDAYNFWLNLRRTSEQLGSIFSPEPSNINGNIHNTEDKTEPVIGYVSACTVQTKRVYINNSEIPSSWVATYPYSCGIDTALYCATSSCINQVAQALVPRGSALLPIEAIPPGALVPIGFTDSDISCVDCSLRGNLNPPPFWK